MTATADIYFKIQDIEQKIGVPAVEWPGNCYAVACSFVEHGVVEGEAVYGVYTGPVDDASRFAGRLLSRHGWVETEDGKIVDPTRWVFEDVVPYVYVTGIDDLEYDRAGIRSRAGLSKALGNAEPPEYDKNDPVAPRLDWDDATHELVESLLGGPPAITFRQLHWLANRSPYDYDSPEEAKRVLKGIADHPATIALIPIDVRSMFGLG